MSVTVLVFRLSMPSMFSRSNMFENQREVEVGRALANELEMTMPVISRLPQSHHSG